jgi:hypothetical protein
MALVVADHVSQRVHDGARGRILRFGPNRGDADRLLERHPGPQDRLRIESRVVCMAHIQFLRSHLSRSYSAWVSTWRIYSLRRL